jgi:hypothetical protein
MVVLDREPALAPAVEAVDGLEALILALRFPERIFGPPSTRPAVANAKPLDWEQVAERLAECLAQWDGRCRDLHFQLHLGAAVLRKHDIKICSRGPRILFMDEEGPLHVFIQLSVDVAPGQASALNHELDDQVIDADVPDAGYCFCFCSGERGARSASGDAPMSSVAAGAEEEVRTPGLEPLVQVLRFPEILFGPASERGPDRDAEMVDWGQVPDAIRRYFEVWSLSCTDVLFHLRLAADVLRDHGVKVCRGGMHLTFLEHEDLMPSVSIELSIDAPSWQPHELTRDLDRRAIALELPYHGFTFWFIDGEGRDDEPVLKLRPTTEKAQSIELHRLLSRQRNRRRKADYEIKKTIGGKPVRKQLQDAQAVLRACGD